MKYFSFDSNSYFLAFMNNKLNNIIDQETLDWLLEDENPSVRYFTLTRLLGNHINDDKVTDVKSKIMTQGTVPQILLNQNPDGYWGEINKFYHQKYRGAVWQLMILAECFADGKDDIISKACEYILQQSQDRNYHGFAFTGKGKNTGGTMNDVIPCLTGNMVWSLIRLGLGDDNRVKEGIRWICKYQRADDGVESPPTGQPYDRFEMCWGKHTCHMGVVKSLKALAEIPEKERDLAIKEKIDQLVEFILIHHIYKRSHDLQNVSKSGWKRFGFPLMYQTDILEILCILTDLDIHDHRMNDGIEILKQKQNKDKRWKLANTYNDKLDVKIETKGQNSKWITARAVYVLLNNELK